MELVWGVIASSIVLIGFSVFYVVSVVRISARTQADYEWLRTYVQKQSKFNVRIIVAIAILYVAQGFLLYRYIVYMNRNTEIAEQILDNSNANRKTYEEMANIHKQKEQIKSGLRGQNADSNSVGQRDIQKPEKRDNN